MTFTLSGGSYSGTTSTLPGGTYNIWTQYGGDSANGPSTSGKTQITVASEASAIDFNMFSGNSYYTPGNGPGTTVDYGTQLMLSALVAPSSQASALQTCLISGTNCSSVNFTVPTGTVNFTDNGGALNTALINAEGDAEYNAPFTVGAHSVAASYAGDKSYNSSTASPITFTVVKDTPTILLGYSSEAFSSSPQNGTNQPTVLTVLIENKIQNTSTSPVPIAAPTGSVTLTSNLTGLAGTVALSAGTDPATLAVAGIATFTVPPGAPTGTYNVSLSYTGDSNYNSFSAAAGTIPITAIDSSGKKSTTTTATMTGAISPNSTVTISGTVTGSGSTAPTGGVYIYSSGDIPTSVGFISSTGTVSTYRVTLNSSTLFQGANFITVQYSGDATYNPSAIVLNTAIANPLSDFTLIPNTTIVPVTAGNSGTTTINLASVNGFSGTVNLTCAAATGVTCTIPASATLTSGGSTTATFTVNAPSGATTGNYNVRITGADTSGQYIHTLGMTAAVTGTTSGTPGFTLGNSGSITMLQAATSGNTSTITVTPTNGFTGAVNLTCAVTTAPAGATSPVTCSSILPTPANLTSASAVTATLTAASTANTTTGNYVITVTGTSGAITQTTPVNVTVTTTPTGSYALTSSGNITVTKGAATGNTSTITVTPSGGFTGTVNLTCAIAPTAASDPASCALSPLSVTISGATAVTSILSIGTTAATAFNTPLKLFWPSTGGAVLALLFFFGVPRRRRNWLAMVGLLVLFVSGVAIGCGGGGGGGGGTTSNPGTTPGTYTVTVTGTSGANSKTTTVTLTVN